MDRLGGTWTNCVFRILNGSNHIHRLDWVGTGESYSIQNNGSIQWVNRAITAISARQSWYVCARDVAVHGIIIKLRSVWLCHWVCCILSPLRPGLANASMSIKSHIHTHTDFIYGFALYICHGEVFESIYPARYGVWKDTSCGVHVLSIILSLWIGFISVKGFHTHTCFWSTWYLPLNIYVQWNCSIPLESRLLSIVVDLPVPKQQRARKVDALNSGKLRHMWASNCS